MLHDARMNFRRRAVNQAQRFRCRAAAQFNSLLAVGAMLLARHTLLRIELGHPWPEKLLRRLLGFTSGLRWLLAIYAILCVGHITLQAAKHWHWPPLGTKWLPWW